MISRVRKLFGSSGSNYPYVTARVRALKTHLLDESTYPKLIARSLSEIARFLEEGQYQKEVNELGGRYSGAQLVERATRLNLGRQFASILDWCKGEPYELLKGYFYRYDVHNVKTVLRGAQGRADPDEVRAALIPAGTVPLQAFEPAIQADSLEEALVALRSLSALRDAPRGDLLQGLETESLSELEDQLDILYYQGLLDGIQGDKTPIKAMRAFVEREIDIVNLKLILRAKHAGVRDVAFVPGGSHISKDRSARLLAASWDEVAGILSETPYGDVVGPLVREYQENRDLNELVDALDHYHLDQAADFGHRYPLSILPIIDYVLRKRREVDRIRIIAVGKAHGLERQEIEELVRI